MFATGGAEETAWRGEVRGQIGGRGEFGECLGGESEGLGCRSCVWMSGRGFDCHWCWYSSTAVRA